MGCFQFSHHSISVKYSLGYDSSFASNVSQALWQSSEHPVLVGCVRSLWIYCSSFLNVSLFHVKAHVGHPFNEMADSLCELARNAGTEFPFIPVFGSGQPVAARCRQLQVAALWHQFPAA